MMRDTITPVDDECNTNNSDTNNSDTNNSDTNDSVYDECENFHLITTYEEWKKNTHIISNIIITNKITQEGFIQCNNEPWRILHNIVNYGGMKETLLGYIQAYQDFGEYDSEEILLDVLNQCYTDDYILYHLNYNEYLVHIDSQRIPMIYNSLNYTFTPFNAVIGNTILTENNYTRFCLSLSPNHNINTDVVDNILNSLITNEIKIQYKILMYNLIVRQATEQIIFYDSDELLLTEWIRNIFSVISPSAHILDSYQYYENPNILTINKYRCVIISTFQTSISIKKQMEKFCELGFQNIIVHQKKKRKRNDMYNILNYKNYLKSNHSELVQCLKEEYNYDPIQWEQDIQYSDNIFSRQRLFQTNYLKWCCVKYES